MIQQKLTKTKTKMILITKTLVIFPLLSSSTSSSSSSLLILTSVSVYSVMCTAPLYPLQDFKALYKYRIITVARGRYSDSGRLLYFGRVIIFYYFFRPPNFRRPWADFRETLPRDAVCPEIVYLL